MSLSEKMPGAPQRNKKTPRAPRVEITITDEIIKQSEDHSSSHCMIAEAVKASYPGATSVAVDLQTIRFSDPTKRLRFVYLTPRAAQEAIVRFDQGAHTEPFKFRIQGAHVIGMYNRTIFTTGAKRRTELRANATGIPRRVGGKAPPKAALGSTRAFGLRAMKI